jgi:hypothetical protein
MIPEPVVNAAAVGLMTTSTGTREAVRVAARSVRAGEAVVVAVLLIAQ